MYAQPRMSRIGAATAWSYIQDLPDELLIEVFILANPGCTTRAKPYWLILMEVCARWREIIRTAAEFWHDIEVVSNLDSSWTRLCLERSQQLPLQVNFRGNSVFDFAGIMNRLAPHGHRLQLLEHFFLFRDQYAQHTTTIQTQIPGLKHLGLGVMPRSGTNQHMWPLPVIELNNYQLPSLQSLHMTDMMVAGPPDAFAGLRELTLYHFMDAHHRTPLSQFLTMLGTCTSLESLTLFHTLDCALRSDVPQGDGRVVTLPNIRKIDLTDTCQGIPELLSHMYIPASVDLQLNMDLTGYDREALVDATASALVEPPFRNRLPILGSVTCLTVLVEHANEERRVFFRGTVDEGPSAGGRIEFAVTCCNIGPEESHDYTHIFFSSLLPEWFPGGSSLTKLICVGDIEGMGDAESWVLTLKHYPNLRTLIVDDASYRGNIKPLFEALQRDDLPCSQLQCLWTRNSAGELDTLKEIRSWLYSRMVRFGGVRFPELHLLMESPSAKQSMTRGVRPLDFYRAELAKLVGKLDFQIEDDAGMEVD